jgi:hypothetical protein
MDYDVSIKSGAAPADRSSLLPGPRLSGYLNPHSLFSSAYIAIHFCFQACYWVMNEEWQAN